MRTTARLFLLALAAGSFAACNDATTPAPGRISLLLTDAEGDIESAVVTISQIYLQGDDADEPPQQDRVVLREEDVTVDLLTLADQTLELVSDATVPGGRYTQLRFVITGGYIEVEQADGSTRIYASSADYEGLPENAEVHGTLRMPSFAQSGLKIVLPGGAVFVDGDDLTLLADFDVSKSFGHLGGASPNWVMHPVILVEQVEEPAGS